MTVEQLSLWQDEEPREISRFEIRQGVLAFLLSMQPDAVALQVPVRRSKFIAGAAAAFIAAKGKQKLNQTVQTIIVEIFTDRDECLPNITSRPASYEKLRQMEDEKARMEAAIRHDEPELIDSCDLFIDSENASYDYKASRKHPYMRLIKRIEKTKHAIYRGSRLENIRRANVADRLFLAVPKGLIDPHELAPGWGMIQIDAAGRAEVTIPAPDLAETVTTAGRNHLALNIARAAAGNVLFANGVHSNEKTGIVTFYPAPRRRRKPLK